MLKSVICLTLSHKQWTQENMFEGKKISLEQTRTIADIILRSLESVQKIGQIVGTAMIK